ncbi:unnamed protein product [Amoebophrya sp. A120]|nr:unnamed protein product [Amoebophrya sp. A120]|eukprot:GSA120T00015332001.1
MDRRPFVSHAPVRPSVLHLFGVESCVTQDLRKSAFGKARVKRFEWLDDSSLNIVYNNPGQLRKAVEKVLPSTHDQFEYCLTAGRSSSSTLVADPEAVWRTTEAPVLGLYGQKKIQFRMCTEADVKNPGHHGSVDSPFYDLEKQRQQSAREAAALLHREDQQSRSSCSAAHGSGIMPPCATSIDIAQALPRKQTLKHSLKRSAVELAHGPGRVNTLEGTLPVSRSGVEDLQDDEESVCSHEKSHEVGVAAPAAKRQKKDMVKLPQPVYRFLCENVIRHCKANVRMNYFACAAQAQAGAAATEDTRICVTDGPGFASACSFPDSTYEHPEPRSTDVRSGEVSRLLGSAVASNWITAIKSRNVLGSCTPARSGCDLSSVPHSDGNYSESTSKTRSTSLAVTSLAHAPTESGLRKAGGSSGRVQAERCEGDGEAEENAGEQRERRRTSPWDFYIHANKIARDVQLVHSLLWSVNDGETFVMTLTTHHACRCVSEVVLLDALQKQKSKTVSVLVRSVHRASMSQVQNFFERQLPPAVACPFFLYQRNIRHENEMTKAEAADEGESLRTKCMIGADVKNSGRYRSARKKQKPLRGAARTVSACDGFLVFADKALESKNVRLYFDLGSTSVQVWSKSLQKIPQCYFVQGLMTERSQTTNMSLCPSEGDRAP